MCVFVVKNQSRDVRVTKLPDKSGNKTNKKIFHSSDPFSICSSSVLRAAQSLHQVVESLHEFL